MRNLFAGTWRKVLIKVILLLLVLYVMYRIGKAIVVALGNRTSKEFKDYVENEVPNTQTNDNSNNATNDTITDNEATLIADKLQFAMEGYGTDETAMFNALQCLNGKSLQKVFVEFGQRSYNGNKIDLFGWFSQELTNNVFSSLVYYNSCVSGCTTYMDSCKELSYMKKIWQKSGLTITF